MVETKCIFQTQANQQLQLTRLCSRVGVRHTWEKSNEMGHPNLFTNKSMQHGNFVYVFNVQFIPLASGNRSELNGRSGL